MADYTQEAPFDVTDPITLEDMSDVQEQRFLVPVAQKVKVRIVKASVRTSKAEDLKGLNCEVRIIDGIEVTDAESGITEVKYVNKPLFTSMMDLCVWAAPHKSDPSTNPKSHQWYKKKQYQVEFKKFLMALGFDVKEPPVINDQWLKSLENMEVLVDIQHEEESAVDQATGQRKKLGTFKERLRNWKSVSEE